MHSPDCFLLLQKPNQEFAVMQRCFVLTWNKSGLRNHDAALAELTGKLRPGEDAEPLPPGKKKRRPLLRGATKEPGEHFKLLTRTVTHFPALMAVGDVYLAMPNPVDNFVSDFQTTNFDSRLFELYLLAAFREQGISVSQDHH